MSIVGYARVSTGEQDSSQQVELLQQAGAERIFEDRGSSSRRASRPQWDRCREYLRAGDVLVVTSLDRLAGTTALAIEIINHLGDQGVHLRSLSEPEIDTTTPMGRALFGIVAVFAQLRVDTIRANTSRGLARAREQGRTGGRPKVLAEADRATVEALRSAGMSTRQIGARMNVSAATVSRFLRSPHITSE